MRHIRPLVATGIAGIAVAFIVGCRGNDAPTGVASTNTGQTQAEKIQATVRDSMPTPPGTRPPVPTTPPPPVPDSGQGTPPTPPVPRPPAPDTGQSNPPGSTVPSATAGQFIGAVWAVNAHNVPGDSLIRVAGATARLVRASDGAIVAETVSGSNGSFAFTSIEGGPVSFPDGSYRLRALPPAGTPYREGGYAVDIRNNALVSRIFLNVVLLPPS